MFQEFPKSLYKGGDAFAEHVIVRDAEEEAAKRAEGFWMHGEAREAEPVKRGPGRPKKAE